MSHKTDAEKVAAALIGQGWVEVAKGSQEFSEFVTALGCNLADPTLATDADETTELDVLKLELVDAIEERDHLRRVLADRAKHDRENVEAVINGMHVNVALNDSYAAAMRRIRELEEQLRAAAALAQYATLAGDKA